MKRKGSTDIEVALRYKRFSELREKGLTLQKIGNMFGYDHSTVSHGVKMYRQDKGYYDSIIEKKKNI